MTKQALWTRNFTLAFVINFFMSIVFYLLMTSIAPYAIYRFEASTGFAGFATGIYLVGLMVGRLIIGRLIDELGARRILILSTAVNLAACAFYFAASSLPLLIANRLVHGITAAMCSTTTATLIAQMVPPHRRGEGIGYYSMSVIVGAALGPFAAVPLIQQLRYDLILWMSVAATALSMVMSCFLGRTQLKLGAPAPAASSAHVRLDRFIDVSVIPIGLVGTVIALSFSGLVAFLSLYAGEIGLTGSAGWFFLVYSIAILVSRPFSGRLLDVKGANIVVYPALTIYAIGMLLFSQADSGSVLLIAAAVIGIGYGNYQSSGQTIAVKTVPPARLGLAMSTYMFLYDLGYGLGPYLSGLVAPYTGYRGLYVITVGIILMALAMYHLLYGRRAIIE
jgi:MFS family permease